MTDTAPPLTDTPSRPPDGEAAPPVPVEALFRVRNLHTHEMGALQWLLLVFWFPIGIPLMFVRAGATILASLIVPPAYRAWWVCTLAGMFTRVRGKTKTRDHGMVVVSNHISYFDRMTVAAAVRSRVPLATLIWHKVNKLNAMMARPTLKVQAQGRNRQLIQDVKTYLESGNILLFPEATVTDGTGLLRFEKMAFNLDKKVILVSVRYRSALPFLKSSALRERLIIQLFYDLFQPWNVCELEVLGVHERGPDETAEQSAQRAQKTIADALDIPATQHTWRDRRKLLKEYGRDLAEIERRKKEHRERVKAHAKAKARARKVKKAAGKVGKSKRED